MKIYETKAIRNVAVCGINGSGKTQLMESILFAKGVTNRMGRVEDGNTVSDKDPIEKERMSSIKSSVISLESDEVKFNFIDTPGYADFYGSVVSAIDVCEVVLLMIKPNEGVDITAKKIWKRAKGQGKTVIVFVSFMDNASRGFNEIIEQLKSSLSPNIAPATAPLGKGEEFKGIIKLIEGVAVVNGKETEIPADEKTSMGEFSESLMDSVAAADDGLMEKYLEENSLSSEEIVTGLSKGVVSGEIVPILCGSSIKSIGINELLEFIGKYAPSPLDIESENSRKVDPAGDFRALVFKAESQRHVGQVNYLKLFDGSLKSGTYIYDVNKRKKQRVNQIAVKKGDENINVDEVKAGDICALIKLEDAEVGDTLASSHDRELLAPMEFPMPIVDRGVYPKNKGEEEKIASAFANIIGEDPTLEFGFNNETREMVLSGIGTLQLELVVKKIKSRYEAEVELTPPKIAYKETVRKKVDNVQGKYKKQTGGRGQYGDCVIRLEPLERGQGFEFHNEVVGGKIPANYIPSVEKGIRNTMDKGVVAGYPVVDFKVALFDGSYHDVDSSDMAFQIAGSMAFQNAMKDAQPYIIEPIMKARISVSNDYTGAVMGDLNSRRGRVLGMEPESDGQVVVAHIPKASLSTYAEDLRSITSGEGDYTVEYDHYEEAPMDVQQQLIAKYQKDREEGR